MASAGPHALVIASPEAALASIPYLVGCTPQESLVLIWMRDSRILVTQRIDIAAVAVPAAVLAQGVHDLHPDEVLVAMYTDGPVPPWQDLRDELTTSAGVLVRDVLWQGAGCWRSLTCQDPGCCPAQGRPLDPQVVTSVAAEMTFLTGLRPAGTLHDIEQEVQRRDDVGDTGPVLSALTAAMSSDLEATRDTAIEQVTRLLGDPQTLGDADRVGIAVMLTDIRVRDTVIWHLAHGASDTALASYDRLLPVLHAAPDFAIPAAACAVAAAAYLAGDGMRARLALEHAFRFDADYSLAQMMSSALATGVPPSQWRSVLLDIPLDVVRHGDAPARA